MVIGLAKRYIISAVNDLLKKNKESLGIVTTKITLWSGRLEKVLAELNKINERVADGEVDTDEVKQSVAEIDEIVANW